MKTFLALFLSIPILSVAQQFVEGSRIIQLTATTDIESVLIPETSNIRFLSRNLNVYEVRFNSEAEALQWEEATSNPVIVHLQKNRFLSKRYSPNDAQYTNQWQHNATASNSPIAGNPLNGDVGSEAAWDRTTGGKLPTTNHDLVVCILDDGVDEDHPDLVDNLWVNTAEIPNNGIDDDNNGFIDDYKGWNTYSLTDELENNTNAFASHGTSVAGMVGATGDNGIGIAGVNHDVKMMIVVADGDEADAIAGYDYPLTMRKKFNSTLGAEGALVVATNASWGVDFGLPSDAPIWCSLYDSLGAAGILNTAATANNNINVDVDGDLPTSCPSDFLISVTNNNALGDKVNFAGYGATTIDLSAPGEDVYTTSVGGYGADAGTSFASPMVAGAVALVYSHFCQDLVTLMATQPREVATYAKRAVLEGVKTQSSQSGLTVSGGSLYLPGSLDKIEQICWDFTGIEESTTSAGYVVYPNPVGEMVTVKSDFNGRFTITNLSGQTQLQGSIQNGLNRLDASVLSAGVYFILLEGKSERKTVKFVKD